MTILPGTGRGTGEAGGGGARQVLHPEVSLARKLRRAMSLPKVLPWQRRRGGKLGGKFRRQHPIGCYVVDFSRGEAGLIAEVDGEAHDRAGRLERDADRTSYSQENGYRVMRIAAADILRDVDAVAVGVMQVARPLHHASHGPPPRWVPTKVLLLRDPGSGEE